MTNIDTITATMYFVQVRTLIYFSDYLAKLYGFEIRKLKKKLWYTKKYFWHKTVN